MISPGEGDIAAAVTCTALIPDRAAWDEQPLASHPEQRVLLEPGPVPSA